MNNLKTHSKPARLMYFIVGALATIAYRLIIILSNVDIFWLKLAWYLGTIGFVIYFIHRFQISEKRAEVIQRHLLDQKAMQVTNLSDEDKLAMEYVFESLKVSSERWIFIIIFISSALALLLGIYQDFIVK